MNIEKKWLRDLFISSWEIEIPFYQRKYDWSEKEVKKLVDDINKNENTEYFLGSIILKNFNTLDGKIIIDGQQRISTLYLILRAIYEHKDLNEKYKSDIERSVQYFKFRSANKFDSNILQKIFTKGIKTLNKNEQDNNYYKNYIEIEKKLSTFTGKINDFYIKLTKVIFAVISIPHNIDEYLIFSQINSTGKKLTAFDLFKNHFFSLLYKNFEINDDDFLDANEYINYKLNLFDKLTNYKNSKINEDLIRRFLSLKTGDLANKDASKIYEFYIEYFEKNVGYNKENLLSFYNEFMKFCFIYKYVHDMKYKNRSFEKELSYLAESFSTYINIVIDVIDKNSTINHITWDDITIDKNQEEEIRKALLILESYRLKRTFCNIKEKVITRFIPKITKSIELLPSNFSYAEKLYFLLKTRPLADNKTYSYAMPSDALFDNEFINYQIYLNDRKTAKYLLERIASFNNKNKIDFSNQTLEHIMPNQLDKWYKDGFDELKEITDLYINTLGNLTLTSYNSELSNSVFATKKEKMQDKQLNLNINEFILQQDCWNTQKIIERSKILLNIVNQIYDVSKIIDNEKQQYMLTLKLNHLLEFEDIGEEILENIRKSSSLIKQIIIDENIIKSMVIERYENNLSLEDIEKKIFERNFSGWVAKSICDYFNKNDLYDLDIFEEKISKIYNLYTKIKKNIDI